MKEINKKRLKENIGFAFVLAAIPIVVMYTSLFLLSIWLYDYDFATHVMFKMLTTDVITWGIIAALFFTIFLPVAYVGLEDAYEEIEEPPKAKRIRIGTRYNSLRWKWVWVK